MARYVQPFNATDPDASFVNGSPSAGIEGSIPDGVMYEVWQRELVNVIKAADITPSNDDLKQVLKAIKKLFENYIIDQNIIGSRIQDYNTPGSYDWTVPENCYALQVLDIIGGGGGGGGANDVTSAASAGAGAGHGQGLVIPVSPGEVLSIVVPDGGSGGLGGDTPTNGVAGGTARIRRSSGSSICAATGGNGGRSSTSGVQPIAALGGLATGCYSNDPGVTGGLGYPSASRFIGGIGGACPSGGGGSPGPNYSDIGKPGLSYGGGGNGSSANGPGGNGAGGRVRFSY